MKGMSYVADDYSESILVEQPAIELFQSLGYEHQNCFNEKFGDDGTPGRETPSDVVLVPRLKSALFRLNPELSKEAIALAIEELCRDRSSLNPVVANKEIYRMLKDGVKVPIRMENGSEEIETVKVIDFDNPETNDFFMASQFWVTGEMYKRRADLVGFVNGLPLIFIELKATHKRLENAYRDNLADYKNTIPQLFWFNAFVILSNGSESRIGTISADWEHFGEWKKIGSEEKEGIVSLDTIIKGTCEKSQFLDIFENFILFQDTGGTVIKIIAKNHQYLGVNSAINKLIATLTPDPSPRGRGEMPHYRGGFQFAGLVERARELRKNQTPAEQILWEMLRDRRFLNLKFRRQHQIGDYIADFYCHDLKLIIELDGSVHRLSDVEKNKILRIQNQTILDNPGKVLEMIHKEILPSPYGRRAEDEGAVKGRLGVFWHTQGSGKSFSMIFFSQKILRKFKGNYTFVIVTDRKELDEQIYNNFLSVGAVTEEEVHAESGEHLKRLLQEDHRNIFTLIHKFRTETGKQYPVVSNRSDIIVITDEAHRTQYDVLAGNMRTALPNAAFIAFTGTPLIVGEELTRKTFGDYVSIYNFKQSVDDGATVSLYYENRIPELQLKNEDLNEDIERIVEESLLDEEQEKKLEREFARQYHLITRNDRLEKIAEDIVAHFTSRGYQGKAMVVAIDKPTAVKMYDKMQKYWKGRIERLKEDLKYARDDKEREVIETKIKFMEETDMAVVVSSEQNEVERFKKLGLDIVNHRKRMNEEDLATKFKDADDPFRIVFVCAMWMTGFDVPCLSTIYLDKPMRNHTLMQTIARANRVFKDKPNGLIVDYIGVFRELQKALAIYGSAIGGGLKEGESPVKPKRELIKELEIAIQETKSFCEEKGIDIHKTLSSAKFERIKLLDDAVDAILVNEESKRKYLAFATSVNKLYKAILPDPEAVKFGELSALFKVIADKIRSLSPEVDISEVMGKVEKLLDNSIEAEGYVIREPLEPYGTYRVDLSQIDFEALKRRFMREKKHIHAERLKNAVKRKLTEMVRVNRSRLNFLEKLQRMIDEYNSGAINVEMFFDKLLAFARELREEEKRGISENLTEEELAIFDLLYKPDLTANEKKQVKLVAKRLLAVLKKEKLVLDWRKRQQTRADVVITIRDILNDGLPRNYTPEVYQQKCDTVYQHIYDAYCGMGGSVYAATAQASIHR